ncbi:hypothetical protein BJX76DRAFT_350152 [Aspergillus varians]
MDLTHIRRAQVPHHQFGLETELSSDSYGTPVEVQRSVSSGFANIARSVSDLPGDLPPWPQRILDEVQDLLLLISPDEVVNYVSPSFQSITGFDTAQIEHDRLSRFIHDDDKALFTRELRECIATSRPLRCHFRMYKIDKSTRVMEAHGHAHLSTLSNDGNQRHFCHGVFLICRPYHSPSTQFLDSLLEHKLENIRLKEYIAQLKKEENDFNAVSQQIKLSQAPSSAAHRPIPQTSKTFTSSLLSQSDLAFPHDPSMISGEDNGSSDALGNIDDLEMSQTWAALDEGNTSHLNGIERITGLFLTEGERSQGISTGIPEGHLYHFNDTDPHLDKQIPAENEPRKRAKGEYQCADCGKSDSPEWRKGPDGPKTLCNACGLRWAKKEKKRQDSG